MMTVAVVASSSEMTLTVMDTLAIASTLMFIIQSEAAKRNIWVQSGSEWSPTRTEWVIGRYPVADDYSEPFTIYLDCHQDNRCGFIHRNGITQKLTGSSAGATREFWKSVMARFEEVYKITKLKRSVEDCDGNYNTLYQVEMWKSSVTNQSTNMSLDW